METLYSAVILMVLAGGIGGAGYTAGIPDFGGASNPQNTNISNNNTSNVLVQKLS